MKYHARFLITLIIMCMIAAVLFLKSEYQLYLMQLKQWAYTRNMYLEQVSSLQTRPSKVIEDHLIQEVYEPICEQQPAEETVIELNKTELPKEIVQDTVQQVTSVVKKEKKDTYFIWPVDRDKFWLSSYFGLRTLPNGRKQFHNGIDMAALKGTPVYAAARGKVESAYEDPKGYGKTIVIQHEKAYKTRYAHLSKMLVKTGQRVYQGQLIGHVGSTGNVRKTGRDASHLHFEVYAQEKRINPMSVLN